MLTLILLTTLFILFILQLVRPLWKRSPNYGDIPAVGNRWPIVGNLFDMSRTHIVLTEWYKQYGGVYRFSLYGEEIVVLSDYESIYEALVTRGSDFAGRPRMCRTDYQDRNTNSIVWQTYTPKLQLLRKQIHSSMRMYGGGLDRLTDRCGEDIDTLISRIRHGPDMTFDPWDLIYDAACNIMLNMALGLRFSYDGEDFAQLKEINTLFNHSFGPGNSRILDRFPVLNIIRDEYKALKFAMERRNTFWRKHTNNFESMSRDDCAVRDLHHLSQQEKHAHHDISESTLKETFTNLILAGTDTTTTALTCFLLVLAHYPDVQSKLQQEVDDIIGYARTPLLNDRAAMPYMEACLMETLRLISHVPLAVPHATICDTMVQGKHIPKDTTVYINLWSMHHDEKFWVEPWKFDPARFLDGNGQLVDNTHEARRRFLVFGAGRRVCLGEALGKNRLFLFATSLLQHFSFVPSDSPLPDLDPRNFKLGIVLHPDRFTLKATTNRRHAESNIPKYRNGEKEQSILQNDIKTDESVEMNTNLNNETEVLAKCSERENRVTNWDENKLNDSNDNRSEGTNNCRVFNEQITNGTSIQTIETVHKETQINGNGDSFIRKRVQHDNRTCSTNIDKRVIVGRNISR